MQTVFSIFNPKFTAVINLGLSKYIFSKNVSSFFQTALRNEDIWDQQ